MRVILIAIGMCTSYYIEPLATQPYNSETICKRLDIATEQSFRHLEYTDLKFSVSENLGFCRSGHKYTCLFTVLVLEICIHQVKISCIKIVN